MPYVLSLLDKSPIPPGASAAQALQHTVQQAQHAETLGYHRFWIAEHHGNTELASTAPELLVAHILAHTRRIRVGSGGVLLQHYSPFKVAESFKLLAALSPGRVDLGVGKAPGGLPLQTRALQVRHDRSQPTAFADLLAELDAFLHGVPPANEALASASAQPTPGQLPQRILLGGSVDSAELAARHGWAFAYAGHFNSDPVNIERCATAYRKLTGRPPILALYALVAHSQFEADQQLGALKMFKLHLSTGQTVNLPSLATAAEFAAQAGVKDYRIEETRPQVIAGTVESVRAALDVLSARYGIEEFVIDTPVADFAARRTSIELLARVPELAEA